MQRLRWGRLFGWVVAWFVATTSCGADRSGGGGSEDAGATAEEPAAKEQPASAQMRAAYIATVQAGAPPEYAVREAGVGLWAQNPAQGFAAEFSDEGLRLTPARRAGAWSFSMAPVRYGCAGALREVMPGAAPAGRGNRVVYRHETAAGMVLEAWYVSGPLGIEQGFTLPASPCARAVVGASGGEVVIALGVGGELVPSLVEQGEAIALRDSAGRPVLRFSDLYVTDAIGQVVPAHLGVDERGIVLRVEDARAVYPLEVDPLIGVQQTKLLPADGARLDQFAISVSVAGDTALVGAPYDDDNGFDSGSAYVFVRSGSTWTQQAKLLAADGAGADLFGNSVSVAGDTALVGAPYHRDNGTESGSAYVFVRSGSTWTQQAKLLAADGAGGDHFGTSVSMSGDTALVGAADRNDNGSASGSAYVFVRNGSTWTQQAKLLASDGAEGDFFGTSVSVEGDTALVGARNDDEKGSAYIFVRSGSMWTQQAKLLSADGAVGDFFGTSVSVEGDTALVGAYLDDNNGSASGSAYVFVRSDSIWTQQAKLLPADAAANDRIGSSVSMSGDTALVGTRGDSAYVFVRNGSTWTQHVKLLPADTGPSNEFGASVSVSANTALLGAYNDDDNGSYSGSAYIFMLGLSNGDLCTLGTECASGFCADGACCDTACDAGPCDACSLAAGARVGGTCTPLTGTPCTDGNLCTRRDTCENGICTPGQEVACSCENQPDGALCEDGNACTLTDTCQAVGQRHVCIGDAPFECPDPGPQICQRKLCEPDSGACISRHEIEGTPCPGGVCIAGGCLPDAVTDSGSAGGGANGPGSGTDATAQGGATPGMGGPETSGGGNSQRLFGNGLTCTAHRSSGTARPWLLAGLLLGARRRRRTPPDAARFAQARPS